MRFTLGDLARALDARLVGTGDPPADPAGVVDGLAIDSRTIEAGQLFAAVTDVRDGHDFVDAARAAGAGAALVEREVDRGASLVVDDVPTALARLARLARSRLPDPVIGVTGSVGKTTTKDMLGAVLGTTFATAASIGSFNNELGVPLTLANAPGDTRATVVEMGARGRGHISRLCSMADPTVGVVTAVHAVHTEVMGDEDDIAKAKAELVETLPAEGLAVLNADDARVAAMAHHTGAQVLTFGASPGADVRALRVTVDDDLRARFTIESPWDPVDVHLGARGAHNVANALAAAGVALWAGVGPPEVAEGLGAPLASPWRMELLRGRSGLVVLNDAYNAGPASMKAALRSLSELPASRRVAVLGTMAELGDRSEEEHRRIAALAAELGVQLVEVGTGAYRSGVLNAAAIDGIDGARALVESLDSIGLLGGDTAVLVKGSRVAGLESVAQALVDHADGVAGA